MEPIRQCFTKVSGAVWASLLLWSVLLITIWLCFPKRVGDAYWLDNGRRVATVLPWCEPEKFEAKQFEAELIAPAKTLSVRADCGIERLEVDGRTILTSQRQSGLRRGYRFLPLPDALGPGKHTLRFTLGDSQSEPWFDIAEAHGVSWRKALILWLLGVGAFALARRCGYPVWVGWPLALAGLLAVQYVEVTTPWVRQHDVEGHREYVQHLVTKRTLPAIRQGWETWQPPLYYCGAAVWQWLFSAWSHGDPFRSVQFLSAVLYLATIASALVALRYLKLDGGQAVAALSILALLPGNLFFAARINNDALLPLLGGGIMLATTGVFRSSERRWLWLLVPSLAAILATKGSSLAIVGGALLMVFWDGKRRLGWRAAAWRTYFIGLPAGLWQVFWWVRTAMQTGDPLYVNAALPENLRVLSPAWRRLLSFDFAALTSGQFYYDQAMRQSYPTALTVSLLYGEYGMDDYGFEWSLLLRLGCLGMLLVLLVGAVIRPRAGLEAAWVVALCLVVCQTALTVLYAVQFPYACNQNMRFFAQAFVPFSLLFGLGSGHLLRRAGWIGRGAFAAMVATFLIGLGDFYRRILF